MAEVFRIANRDSRDVTYDYSEAERERLWNDSEPTAPGPVGDETPPPVLHVVPHAPPPAMAAADRPLPSLDGPVHPSSRSISVLEPSVDPTAPGVVIVARRRWSLASSLLVLGVTTATAAAIFLYLRGGNAPPAVASPLPAASTLARVDHQPVVETVAKATAVMPTVVALASAAPVAATPHLRRHPDRHRGRRVDPTASRVTPEAPDLELPVAPTSRRRLRPIDVTDPFAP